MQCGVVHFLVSVESMHSLCSLLPNKKCFPHLVLKYEWFPPHSICSTRNPCNGVAEVTRVGEEWFSIDPTPSCPNQLYPQAYTLPSSLRASEWYCPHLMSTTLMLLSLKNAILLGMYTLSPLLPWPSCP